MKAKAVPISDLIELGKWRADLHVHEDAELSSEKFKLVRLAEVVIESKTARDPSEFGQNGFYYIGLENVEPITGESQGISMVTSEQVRSRSKVFTEGDILYGRLRPYLRKAFYVEPPYTKGLCSTEFIVLNANTQFILPLFLREILISDPVTELVSRLQAGAALPRVSSKDLLNICVPVPPLKFQEECVAKIERFRNQRRELLLKANALTKEGQKVMSEVFD
ncbi:type I restriction enzyme, S subunit [Ectothiorhodospira magna]|uniref:Type I restriction enzyme, S subunit n=1 Tax=Ectothiorhodospira magna TaxID=867345 RepID=A0A1H9DJ16_9GAMM|nr:restriction endonuclease subunit S [Ectothiorhodospira magna]SEQ12728.1 type I restriction enzyme, S subunit [Ectothiorhodospira magna]